MNNSTTGPDGYGSAGFPGAVGDKGDAGEPSRVEGSRGSPGQKGDRGVPGLYSGEWDLIIICFSCGLEMSQKAVQCRELCRRAPDVGKVTVWS